MSDTVKTVCFTGHRPDKLPDKRTGYDETNPTVVYVKKELTSKIIDVIEGGYTRFIVGGALGVDTWAGEILVQLREEMYHHITIELFSPFEGQEGNWPLESQIRYYNLMAQCDNIKEISEAGYAAWKMIVRDKAMVDEADLVIAVWNGDLGRSGTGHTVTYAKKRDRKLIIVDPREAVR